MNALLLCAGFGTRLGAVARGRPKALLPIAGKPLIQHFVDDLRQTGHLDRLHLVTNEFFFDQFEAWAKGDAMREIAITLTNDGATENENRLGAIRDLALAVRQNSLRGPLLVAAGDNLFDFPLGEFVEDYLRQPRTLVVVKHEDDPALLRRTGVAEIGPGGRLERLHEKPQVPPSSWTCPALYIFAPDAIEAIGEFLDGSHDTDAPGNLIAWLAEHRSVFTHTMRGDRMDVGDPEGYRRAEAWLARRTSRH